MKKNSYIYLKNQSLHNSTKNPFCIHYKEVKIKKMSYIHLEGNEISSNRKIFTREKNVNFLLLLFKIKSSKKPPPLEAVINTLHVIKM